MQRLRLAAITILMGAACLSSGAAAQNTGGCGGPALPDTGASSANPPDLRAPPTSVSLPTAGVEVPMQYANDIHPFIEVMVNGRGPYRFFVETGSAVSLITPAAARSLGLSEGGVVTIDSVNIGPACLRHFSMVVTDMPGGTATNVAGHLGLNAYHDLLLTVDFQKQRVRFTRGALSAAGDSGVVPWHTVTDGFVAFYADVAGKRVETVLDTQAGAPFMAAQTAADSLPFVQPPVVMGGVVGRFGTVDRKVGRLQGDVRLGGVVYERPIVSMMDMPPPYPQTFIIGPDALREFVVTLDQREHLVRFAHPAHARVAAPPAIRRIGVRAPQRDAGRVIEALAPGEEAERQGMQVGDVIESINGRPMASVDESTWGSLLSGPDPVTIVAHRGTETKTFTITPRTLVP